MNSENSSKKEKYYKWILFDADDTLFKFDSFTGLKHMFQKYDFEFNEKDFEEYQVVNHALWADLQKGLITQKELQARRFHVWAERVTAVKRKIDPNYPEIQTEELNNSFLDSMAITSTPLDGCLQLLNSLKGRKVKIGIITNGFTRLQEARLRHLGLEDYFDLLVISEKVGLAKPSREIFDHALSLIGDISRHEVLMVGDTLESDILGGNNAEIDTFWLNSHKKVPPEHIVPTYEASSLPELEQQILSMIDEDERGM